MQSEQGQRENFDITNTNKNFLHCEFADLFPTMLENELTVKSYQVQQNNVGNNMTTYLLNVLGESEIQMFLLVSLVIDA